MKQLKKNNTGFSLVEVLVAIMVLAIVITPFLRSFVAAATANSKAKEIHKATVLAQSVMEGLKTEDVESIALQFSDPSQGFRILPTQYINGGSDLASHVEQISHADGKYQFALDSVQQDRSEYDVLIELDATEYRTAGAMESDDYNSIGLVELPVTDLEQDAVCVEKDSYMDSAMSELGITDRNKLRRKITITVENSRMISGDYRTRVLAEYHYTGEGITGTSYTKSVTCFDNTESGKDLRSVYLYYFPLYPTAAHYDEILLVNDAKLPITFYLMKQAQAVDIMTSSNENYYYMTLSIQETGAALENIATAVRTNLLTNLADDGTGINFIFPRKIKFNESELNESNLSYLSSISKWQSHLVETTQDRVFDIKIEVYEEGAKAAGFPQDMRVTTLDGSRLD